MTLAQLKTAVRQNKLQTVEVGCPDVFGRIVGKRFSGPFFVREVADHGTHGCNYLLTVDIDMEPMTGFRLANWESGFGDFEMRLDPGTIRTMPWQQGTALVLADFYHEDGRPVAEAPRQVLRWQEEELRRQGLRCQMASELEFYLYRNSYREAFARGYDSLQPSSDFRIDYQLGLTGPDEPILGSVRKQMPEARVPVESSKGEWGRGQHEVNFVHDTPLAMGDIHTVFKHGMKLIAGEHAHAVTFMAKPSMAEAGNSCHIHASLWRKGSNLFWDTRRKRPSRAYETFLGGLLKYSRELSYFFAPTVNSYKRFQPGSWAPTRMAWSCDNRTTGFRVVGRGSGFRIENRMPGADANPYLAFAATLAAGRAGMREGLDCGPSYQGNAYVDEQLERLPVSLEESVELLERSKLAREAFGEEVVEFYVHTGRLEVRAFASAVTDWEKRRYFERI